MKRKSTLELLKDKSGAALITVLVIFLTLVVIVTSATMMSHANFMRAQKTANFSSAYYVAEAGLNEAYEQFVTYFEENKDKSAYNQTFANGFLEYIGATEGKKTTDYDTLVMNEIAKSVVSIQHMEAPNGGDQFRLYSEGYLGVDSRTVELIITISLEGEATIYQPDSALFIDFENPDDKLEIGQSSSYTGPIVTNKPLVFHGWGVNLSGPFVTSNNITLETTVNTINNSGKPNAVFITSGNLIIDTPNTIHAVVLKGTGKVIYNKEWSIGTIEYLLVPKGATSYKEVVSNATLNIKNIIFYSPLGIDENSNIVGFDPYEAILTNTSGTVLNNQTIFGPKPADTSLDIDYRKYFKPDFVLDNLYDDKGEENAVLPQVVLPKKPIYDTYYPVGDLKKGTMGLVNNNNDFSVSFNYNNTKARYDLTELGAYTVGGSLYRSFNSMKIGGSSGSIETTKLYVGNQNIVFITKALEINNIIEIIGTGSLTIYVVGDGINPITSSQLKLNPVAVYTRDSDDETKYEGKIENRTKDYSKLQLIVYETRVTKGKGLYYESGSWGLEAYLSIYSDNLNLKVSGSGQFNGVFVSAQGTDVSLSGGTSTSSQLIFAPNAKISVSGGAKLSGVLVGKDYDISGGVSVSFSSEFEESFVNSILPNFIVPGGTTGSNNMIGSMQKGVIREVD